MKGSYGEFLEECEKAVTVRSVGMKGSAAVASPDARESERPTGVADDADLGEVCSTEE